MKPLAEFPEVPEGLEREVYELYESTVEGKGYSAFSTYFRRQVGAGVVDERQAKILDALVDGLYGTYESIKMVTSEGRHKRKAPLDFNIFVTATLGSYNDAGLVFSGSNKEQGGFGDYKTLSELSHSMLGKTEAIGRLSNPPKPSNLRGPALEALQDKLRFEAAIYEGMKKLYGVTVELPSPDTPPAA